MHRTPGGESRYLVSSVRAFPLIWLYTKAAMTVSSVIPSDRVLVMVLASAPCLGSIPKWTVGKVVGKAVRDRVGARAVLLEEMVGERKTLG